MLPRVRGTGSSWKPWLKPVPVSRSWDEFLFLFQTLFKSVLKSDVYVYLDLVGFWWPVETNLLSACSTCDQTPPLTRCVSESEQRRVRLPSETRHHAAAFRNSSWFQLQAAFSAAGEVRDSAESPLIPPEGGYPRLLLRTLSLKAWAAVRIQFLEASLIWAQETRSSTHANEKNLSQDPRHVELSPKAGYLWEALIMHEEDTSASCRLSFRASDGALHRLPVVLRNRTLLMDDGVPHEDTLLTVHPSI